ncbi:hypothetical protein [Aquimarina aquimarini]|uniref:hypothetical protein n=1 Tax=Aquimarina aquimarini TaxID=1191734 RepID=UPI00131F3549|nr:hypothetical protein [Aquimarina aquimarini]
MKTITKEQKKFITKIVKYLHMDITDFLNSVTSGRCYEKTIYDWVVKLYHKGVNHESAIQIICRARVFLLTRNSLYFTSCR